MRGSIPRRWCTGASGWRSPIARTVSTNAVKKVVEETGILKGRRRQAVDSTILADAVLHANYRISGRQGKQGKAPATQTRRMESVSVCSRRDLPHPDGIPHS